MDNVKHIKIKNKQKLNLDVEIYSSSKESSKFIILSTAFGTNIDYNPAYRLFAKKAASKGYNVILYSFTGSGKSEGVFSKTTLETQKDDLNSIIEYVRKNDVGTKICLVGHSLGASVSVLVYNQNIKNNKCDINAIIAWNSSIDTENLYKRYAKHYANKSNMTYEHFRELTNEKIISGRAMWESFKDAHSLSALSKVSIPILSIFGEKDDLVKSEIARGVVNNLPKGESKIIPDCDHEFTIPRSKEQVIDTSLKWLKNNF